MNAQSTAPKEMATATPKEMATAAPKAMATAAPKAAQTSPSISESNLAVLGFGAKFALRDTNLTLEKMLRYAIQDEFLEHAEYAYILKTFGDQRPFNNIIQEEEKHISLLKPLFESRKLAIPQDNSSEFLMKPRDLDLIFQAAVQAEIENIEMYDMFLEKELPEDVKAVFTELVKGSRNHLATFKKK